MAPHKRAKAKTSKEFGDFQTPPALALSAAGLLWRLGIRPRSILEPTCGRGAFLAAAATTFPTAERIIGLDINDDHLAAARGTVGEFDGRVVLQHGDFFRTEWRTIVKRSDGPWLIIGNPPWVTSSELGCLGSDNLPAKSNFHRRPGIEAITGKSNFDISEWMLLRYADWLEGCEGAISVLCKTAVARRILQQLWRSRANPVRSARIYKIDAISHFGAAVDACFLVLELAPHAGRVCCEVFDDLAAVAPSHMFGFSDGCVINNFEVFHLHRDLLEPENRYIWRSGIKHDCSKVMELAITTNGFENGFGEPVEVEDALLFPLLKSSDIGNGRIECRGRMLVTQRAVGEDTGHIRAHAPRTWSYLQAHAEFLEKRASSIYRNKPRFSIFGVGPYSFMPWKIAISGFYKKLRFMKIGPIDGKPVVFDDTIYFLPCGSEEEADFLYSLLQSEPARAFFDCMIHWDEKRPITADILKRLSIRNLARRLGMELGYDRFTGPKERSLFDSASAPMECKRSVPTSAA